MKVKDLIEQLSKVDPEMEVCILDNKLNLDEDFGDGSKDGIYNKFEVVVMTLGEIPDDTHPKPKDKSWSV